ncbi:alpha/beta hydrolase [uncultured Acinetobacter sp.]|uniref:alpha/beta hydrolase n=1 Tax=uncultured Acinetobacter sp. TaxID=165433 RepID=UPI00258ACA9C|nr:alpha/beta hydrolase [uncultured Acinetobacter sp.]
MSDYSADLLGEGYEQQILNFPDDYEGRVVATLVRKKANHTTDKAVLYIHGYIDYFFQKEMAEQFNLHGYDFYALDLRKYGRSKLPHQTFFNVHDLREYDAEISRALELIEQESHHQVLLAGHSTGGLIATLYAAHYRQNSLIKALWVNSPFYEFNLSLAEKKLGIPLLSQVGRVLPRQPFPSKLNRWYVTSLHQSLKGEWDFDLNWKPVSAPTVLLSFVHAIHSAQKEIHKGVYIDIPVLVMHSHQTKNPKRWHKSVTQSDVILNVKDIRKYAKKIKGDVTIQRIQNGVHDLVLSAPAVREAVYQKLFQWLNSKISSY